MAEEANSSRNPLTAAEKESHACSPSQGHEGRIVHPYSYLRPRGFSLPPMHPVQSQKSIDREERQGLVCFPSLFFFCLVFCLLALLCILPPRSGGFTSNL